MRNLIVIINKDPKSNATSRYLRTLVAYKIQLNDNIFDLSKNDTIESFQR